MRLVLRVDGGEVDVEVTVHDPVATVADLAAALRGDAPAAGPVTLVVDGVEVQGHVPLVAAGVRPGCLVTAAGEARQAEPADPDGAPELIVVGGVAAGGRHRLNREGPSTVGRDPTCTAVLEARTTSRRHAAVVAAGGALTLVDGDSSSGTWVAGRRITEPYPLLPDDVVAIAATLVRVATPAWREPAVLGPPEADGRRPLHRPPPAARLAPAGPVTPPAADSPAGEAPRFAWAAALVPLLGGLVLARLVDPRLALFTLLSPAVLVGQWLEERRRHRRRGTQTGTERRAELAAFRSAVEASAATEARRRAEEHPDPPTLGEEIEALGSGLWSRGVGHPAFGSVSVGVGPGTPWAPAVTRPAEGAAAQVLASCRLPHGALEVAELAPGQHLGIAGPRPVALAVARWVVLQLAAHHGPAHLRLAVTCGAEGAEEWGWTAFLPHTAAPGSADRRLLASGPAAGVRLAEVMQSLRRLDSGCAAGPPPPHIVVVVDGDRPVEGGAVGSLVDGEVTTLTIAASRRALPARCTAVLELDGSDGWAQLDRGGGSPHAVLATGVDRVRARAWARRLSGLVDPQEAGGAARPPAAARLLDLLDMDEPSAPQVLQRWSRRAGLATPIGCAGGADGASTLLLDLVADGPHALVAGTTGAGKSELLRTLVAGLAASSPPDRLAMLLVDYKGGAAFAATAELPHVLGVVTDLGPDDAARALHSLSAELRRREAVLRDLGVRDLAEHPAHGAGPTPTGVEPLPRIVIVVDELAALATEIPTFLDGLVQLAARGRSLGLHLVLATQRPSSVVSAAVRTNCTIRCCLRVPDDADALDVVGSAAPARLDRRQPGRAFLRRGAGDLVELQVALVAGTRPLERQRVSVGPAGFGPDPPAPPPAEEEAADDLAALVGACRAAAHQAHMQAPRPIWLPPLPSDLAATELPPGEGVVLGIADDPSRQRRLPLVWRPEAGPLLALGSGAAPALALQAASRVLAARLGPGQLHVYGFDLGAQALASLGGLAQVGALVRPGEPERAHRLVQRLADELSDRQAGARSRPDVLVLIDGVAALRTVLDGAAGLAALDALERVVVDGAPLGLFVAIAADRVPAVPPAWRAAASCRLALRGGDAIDLLGLGGITVDQSRWPVGRCLDLGTSLVAQLATHGWEAPRGHEAGEGAEGPAPVVDLPRHVVLADVLARTRPHAGADGPRLPLGIDGRRLEVAVARLRPGQPFLVCGPPGSGRSTALATFAAAAREAGCEVIDVADGREVGSRMCAARGDQNAARLVVIVDDADRVEDLDGSLARLVTGRQADAHLVAAVPPEAVRGAFGHWTAELRRAGAGIVLRPRSELDADVLGVPLLPRWTVPLNLPGRGVLVVEGEALPVQVAVP